MANTKKYVSLDKLGLYDEKIKGVISAGDAASLQSAKDYADSLATNYDAAGAAATEAGKVQAELDKEVARAKAREDEIAGLVATAQGEVDALELVVDTKAAQADLDALAGKVGAVPEGSTVMGIIGEIQENAYDDTALRAEMAEELAKKADKTQVATDIETAVNAEKSARETAVAGVQSAVDTLSGTHATDKKALEDAIALKADQSALDEVSGVANAAVKQADYDVKVAALEAEDARIAGLVAEESAKAREEEGKLDARLVEVETFFKTAEGETIDQAMDTLVEIQKYITEDGAAADEMVKDIAANAKAIEDHLAVDHDFAAADAALKSELEGKINGKVAQGDFDAVEDRVEAAEGKIEVVEGKVSTLESEMDEVQAAVATKAEAQDLTDAVAALEDADADLADRLEALEAKHGDGEGTVESMIATAKQEAIDAAAGDATTKANKALEDAKAYADAEDAKIESRVDALEAKAHEHANKELLDTYTQTNADLADAVAKKHEHSNLSVLEAITSAKVAAWDAAEQAAKTYADGLNTAMNSRVEALETWHENFVECSETEIADLFK